MTAKSGMVCYIVRNVSVFCPPQQPQERTLSCVSTHPINGLENFDARQIGRSRLVSNMRRLPISLDRVPSRRYLRSVLGTPVVPRGRRLIGVARRRRTGAPNAAGLRIQSGVSVSTTLSPCISLSGGMLLLALACSSLLTTSVAGNFTQSGCLAIHSRGSGSPCLTNTKGTSNPLPPPSSDFAMRLPSQMSSLLTHCPAILNKRLPPSPTPPW